MTEYMVGVPIIHPNRIYAGRVVKRGCHEYMSDTKTDVTEQAIYAVMEHLLRNKGIHGMDSVELKIHGK